MGSFANTVKSQSQVGLISYWRLDETTGTSAADKESTNTGTYTGAPTLGVAGTLADGNKAVTLNGSSQYVTMGSKSALRPTAAVSLEVLFKPAVVNVARQSITGVGSTTKGYLLCLENAALKFYVNGTAASFSSLVAATCYHVVATYDGANVRIYINGRLQATQALTGAIDYTGVTDFLIGQRHGVIAGEYLNGTVDECAAYNRALAAREALIHQDTRSNRGPAYACHVELSGIGNGWTDITRDLIGEEEMSQGLPGASVRDRVAGTGELHITLNNGPRNSKSKRGLYSPDHDNHLIGFDYGARMRYAITTGVQTYYRHVGTIDDIDPMAGLFDEQVCHVTSLDYMDELAATNVNNSNVQVQQTDSSIFSTLIASMPKQPSALQVGAGLDTFAYALDNVQDEETKMMSVLADLAMSALSLIYVKGGIDGDVLTYEPRNIRAASTSVMDTFDDTLFVNLESSRSRGNAINRIKVISHPKRIDATPTTMVFDLQSPILIAPGDTVTYLGPYTDPANLGQRIGATAIVTPLVSTTNYLMNTASDGTGADISVSLDATSSQFFGNTAMWVLKNNSAVSGYVTRLRAFGKGIYDYNTVVAPAESTSSQAQAGVQQTTLDMIYQSDPKVASEVAYYIVNIFKDARTLVKAVGFKVPNSDDVLAERLIRRQISDRIAVKETQTGIATSKSHFINHVTTRVDDRGNLSVEFLLAPADQTAYWLLEIVGRSELDISTVLGFGLIVGHTDVAHGDIVHGDVTFVDTIHTDSHTDDAHQDHTDATHTDVAHGDVTHADSSHNDTAHTDVAHSDVAHQDSHSDVAHSDVAHVDSHTDSHGDAGAGSDFHHTDSHGDTHGDSHSDVAHSDVAHSDVAHSDTVHQDVAHGDTAHGDTAHADTVHQDVAGNTHADVLHGDVVHGDVAHGDVLHIDSAHSDTAHGDAN